ncbi:MAG: hypothetical protein KDD89_11225, partial [Anaerolineales bacterium]|nr:hypothetical protein [Anaerolineales bacterium]
TEVATTTAVNTTDSDPEPATAVPTDEPIPTAVPTETPIPTATPIPAKELIVCMSAEPRSLYLYNDYSPQATAVRHAIYDSLYTTSGFVYQPRALADLPTLENGGVQLTTVPVGRGDTVLNSRGEIITLREGDTVISASGEAVSFDGNTAIDMPQMVVDFTFQPLVWSDGTPLTADDSLFSFELAADRHTPSNKDLIRTTATYTTTSDLGVRWAGLPGYFDADYMQHVWTPLPRHQLGDISPRDMLEERMINRRPLSYGPFVVTDWVRGEQMTLEKNPHYYRTAEGLPYIDRLLIRFIPAETDLLTAVLDGSCDMVTSDSLPGAETAGLSDLLDNDGVNVQISTGRVLEHLAFGINQFSFSEEPLRPDWFQETAVRQAIAHCTDREAIISAATLGISELASAYETASHPLYPADTAVYAYDPAVGNALLDQVGFVDSDEDGIRNFTASTRPFSITLQTTDSSPLRLAAAEQLAANLADCGINVTVEGVPPTRFFSPETDGVIFRRQFDLAAYPLLLELVPACQLYTTANIPGPDFRGFLGWQASNVTGFIDGSFDSACEAAQNSLYGTAEYEANHQQALRLFAEQLPILPLFTRVKVAVLNPAVQNFQLDPAEDSDWWTVAEWDLAE